MKKSAYEKAGRPVDAHISTFTTPSRKVDAPIPPREMAIIAMHEKGCTYEEIVKRLGISPSALFRILNIDMSEPDNAADLLDLCAYASELEASGLSNPMRPARRR